MEVFHSPLLAAFATDTKLASAFSGHKHVITNTWKAATQQSPKEDLAELQQLNSRHKRPSAKLGFAARPPGQATFPMLWQGRQRRGSPPHRPPPSTGEGDAPRLPMPGRPTTRRRRMGRPGEAGQEHAEHGQLRMLPPTHRSSEPARRPTLHTHTGCSLAAGRSPPQRRLAGFPTI